MSYGFEEDTMKKQAIEYVQQQLSIGHIGMGKKIVNSQLKL